MRLTKEEMDRLWAQAQENARKLTACPAHKFECTTPELKFERKYRCSRCEGTVDAQAFHWYCQGLKHGILATEEKPCT
jgi:hypothetical protein